MKRFILIAALTATPAAAQDKQEGLNLIEEGAKLFLRGLMDDMEPTVNEFRDMVEEFGPAVEDFAVQIGPALSEMLSRVDDLRHYSAPEFLPNGDIILRRKPEAPSFEPAAPIMENGVEL